jgi:hypothetical protein
VPVLAEPKDAPIQSNEDALAESWPDVVFSLSGNFVWAGWPGTNAAIKLGRHEAVAAMMRDFLEQSALGEQLATREAGDQ